MPPWLREAFVQELKDIHDRQPPYKKDIAIRPFDPLEAGVDCSRYPFLAMEWAIQKAMQHADGIGVKRVTAQAMYQGHGGWEGREVSHLIARPGDLVWWIFRGQWHVGAVFEPWSEGHGKVIHSSSSRRGPVIDPWRGALFREMHGVKELTIGD